MGFLWFRDKLQIFSTSDLKNIVFLTQSFNQKLLYIFCQLFWPDDKNIKIQLLLYLRKVLIELWQKLQNNNISISLKFCYN